MSKPTEFTFRNRYPTQRVRLGKGGPTIQFAEGSLDDEGHMLGVYRTTNPTEAEAIRQAIAKGGVPAWEEDEEEREAVKILTQRRERAAARLAEQAKASMKAAG